MKIVTTVCCFAWCALVGLQGLGAAEVQPAVNECSGEFQALVDQTMEEIGQRGYLGLGLHWHAGPTGIKDVEIADVDAGSPAARAGLQAGDRIVAFSGRALPGSPIEAAHTLFESIDKGQTVRMTVVRDGKRLDKTVRAGEMPLSARLEALGLAMIEMAHPHDSIQAGPRFYGDVPEEIRRQVEGEKH